MIAQWLTAIEDLLIAAPGNADEDAGVLWDSVLDRLGVATAAAARARMPWDYPEADDLAPERPFFILTEKVVDWSEYTIHDLAAQGVVEVAYTEEVWTEATTHKEAKNHFLEFTGRVRFPRRLKPALSRTMTG